MFEDNIVFDKFMKYGPNENPMEYELVGAASEGKEMEDRDEPVESVYLEGELVEYEPVGTSQSSRNFENIDESSILVELFVGQRFDSWSLAEHCLKDMDGRIDL
ncbi:hypothetical protein C2G38_2048532 [Gigaspora rosea]|uniref:Uncharacterized protein n=1 Tax=Gigaspora rosea TaxID=44941 RepID=A0A397U206_9GLOM|nr:hypothetical protein C2G38_2048532 [Gigaspora rosea]